MPNILDKISFEENKRRYLNLKGIASRRYAYKAPDIVQIDLTNRCNSHCLICWLHSPFLKTQDTDDRDLDLLVLKNFIGDVSGLGTKEIIFSGGGEPFLYHNIWEVLEFTQNKGLVFRINTNFTLLDKGDIGRLLSFKKLTSIVVSIWAGEPELYSKLHNRDVGLFDKVKENLKLMNTLKSPAVDVRICVVLNNLNYRGLRDLLALAAETGCDAIEFAVPDVIPGVTDSFLLTQGQLDFLKQDFMDILRESNKSHRRPMIINKDIFLRRISSPKAGCGEYDEFAEKSPCYAGWTFLRLRANGDFNSCLKSHRLPIGNIYKDTFNSIWNNALQQDFRMNSVTMPRDNKYFEFIGNGNGIGTGCRRVCDNILVNKRLREITKHLFWL